MGNETFACKGIVYPIYRAAPLEWDAAVDNLVERIDRAIPELSLLTDRQGIISMTDINGNPCQWPNCNFGLARTVEQPIDRAIPNLDLLTDRQGIISMTDINGNPCEWPNCNFG